MAPLARWTVVSIVFSLAGIYSVTNGAPFPRECFQGFSSTQLQSILKLMQNNISEPTSLENRAITGVELSSGQLWGLSRLQVDANDSFQMICDLRRPYELQVVFSLRPSSMEGVKIKYSWVGLLNRLYHTNGTLLIVSQGFKARVNATMDLENYKTTLNSLQLSGTGSNEIRFTGMGYVTWFSSKIATKLSNVFNSITSSFVESLITKAFDEFMKEFQAK